MLLRLDPELADRLGMVAQVEGRPVSGVVRDAIAAYVDARRRDPEFRRLRRRLAVPSRRAAGPAGGRVRALDLVDVVALAAEVSDVEPPKLLELLDTPEVGALLAEAQAPLPPHEAAAVLLVGLVEIGALPTANRRLALLAALHLLARYGLEVDLHPHATRDLLASVQAGGHDAPSVAAWLAPHVTARDPLDGALHASLSADAWRAIGLAVDRARRQRRLLASPADLLLGLFREGTGPAALALGSAGTTAEVGQGHAR